MTVRTAVAVIGLSLILSPWLGALADRAMSPAARATLAQQHADHRIAIWRDFGKAVAEHPLLGYGFNASFSVGQADDPDEQVIAGIHPHNVFLQVWIELGFAGALVFGGGLRVLYRRLSTLPTAVMPSRMAQLCTIVVLSLVWQNPWRPWWLAALGLAWAVFLIDRSEAAAADAESTAKL